MHAGQPDRPGISAIAATAAIVVVGAQLIRVFKPLIGWYLRDVEGVGTLDLIPDAVAPFLTALLTPLLVRLAGPRRAIWLVAAGLGCAEYSSLREEDHTDQGPKTPSREQDHTDQGPKTPPSESRITPD